MRRLKILNKKEIKQILRKIKEQWGAELDLDYAFLMSPKNKIYIVNRDVSKIDLSKLNINNIGLYFGELKLDELRLSIEGTQIVGEKANKNIVELNKEQAREWFRGENVEIDEDLHGFILLKHNNDFLGCGKYSIGRILNFVAKARRVELI